MDKEYQEVLKPDESSVQDAVYLITDKMAELSKIIESVQKDFILLGELIDNTNDRVKILAKENEKLEKDLTDLSHRLLVLEREGERKRRRWQEFKDLVSVLLFTAVCMLAMYGAGVLTGVLSN